MPHPLDLPACGKPLSQLLDVRHPLEAYCLLLTSCPRQFNTPDPAKRALIIGINGWANVASVVSAQFYQAKYKPSCEPASRSPLAPLPLR